MINRNQILENILLTDFTTEQTESFFSYQLIDSDFEFIKENIKKTLTIIPNDAFNCAMLSAILGAKIFDDSQIPVAVIAGHLDYAGQRVFTCSGPIPNSSDNTDGQYWDGHCWIEFGGYVLDISFFRTIYYGIVPDKLKNKVISEFGEGRGSLMGKPNELQKSEFTYTPCHIVTQNQIDGLIVGAEFKYFNKKT